jgi:lipoprotein-anchoring transpeptidase ErfK/SrfK
VALALAAAGCASSAGTGGSAGSKTGASSSPTPTQVSAAQVSSNIATRAQKVSIGRTLRLAVASGTFKDVTVSGPKGALAGALSADKSHWHSTAPLQPNGRYVVTSTAVDTKGLAKAYRSSFHTAKLTLDQQTFPSFFPTGGTVGVGMPVIIHFDVPVTDRARIERHLKVTSAPAQVGSFHWISSQEVHWRPRTYWKPGTTVTVKANIGGVPAGNGIYGQLNRQTSFHIGRAMVSRVNIKTDQMHVFENGSLIRTIPITTGKPGFNTRSGIKVIVEKKRHTRMNSETIGIDPKSTNGYDLSDVQWAMRLTYSGEFLHAAPWSVAQQGHSNVSHGCTGMSDANAQWLYDRSIVGDPVEYTGSSKYMTLTNGFGDWNLSYANYAAGSAVS